MVDQCPRLRRKAPAEIASSSASSHSSDSCNVGMGVDEAGGGGGGATGFTVTLAVAVPVAFTLKLHDAPAASAAPDRLTLLDPATAVIAPPPQLPLSPFGVETTSPAGRESVKPTPVSDEALGLVSVKLSDVELLTM